MKDNIMDEQKQPALETTGIMQYMALYMDQEPKSHR